MSEVYVINKELLFKNSIYEITSISIEHNFDVNGSNCEGEFIISGDYRLHEISINKEDFSFKIPFSHEVRSNINLDSIGVIITDFSYELLNHDELDVHIEYELSGEQNVIEFADEKSLDEFLTNNEAEIIDLSANPELDSFIEEKVDDILTESTNEIEEVILEPKNTDRNLGENNEEEDTTIPRHINNEDLVASINSEEVFVKYHVHTVTEYDTLESIIAKYNITLVELKKYNTFDNLELNMKLIVPKNEES